MAVPLVIPFDYTRIPFTATALDHLRPKTDAVKRGRERVFALETAGLIVFALKHDTDEPAVFLAPDAAFENETDLKLAHLILDSFQSRGDFDGNTGRIVGDRIEGKPLTVKEWLVHASAAIGKLAEDTKMSRRVIGERCARLEADGMLAVRLVDNGVNVHVLTKDITALDEGDRRVVLAIGKLFGGTAAGRLGLDGQPRETGPGEHTYMRAIEMQYRAIADLSVLERRAAQRNTHMFKDMTASELWSTDIAILKRAETFCWFEEPTLAVEAVSTTLPDSVRMTRDLTESYSGWWYFLLPLPITTVQMQIEGQTRLKDQVVALLWTWAGHEAGERSGLRMTAFVYDTLVAADGETLIDGPAPTTVAIWPEGLSLADAIREMAKSYDSRYDKRNEAIYPDGTFQREQTLHAIEQLFRFFAAGCLWMQQRILALAHGHVERHARKRLEKAQPDRPFSDVQLIQLRRKQVEMPDRTPGETITEWKCRWLVGGTTGFWRNQYFPSTGKHQPVHIAPYIKGPADKPLKVPTHRVYVVNR